MDSNFNYFFNSDNSNIAKFESLEEDEVIETQSFSVDNELSQESAFQEFISYESQDEYRNMFISQEKGFKHNIDNKYSDAMLKAVKLAIYPDLESLGDSGVYLTLCNFQKKTVELLNQNADERVAEDYEYNILYALRMIEPVSVEYDETVTHANFVFWGKMESTIFGLMVAKAKFLFYQNQSISSYFKLDFQQYENKHTNYFIKLNLEKPNLLSELLNKYKIATLEKKIHYSHTIENSKNEQSENFYNKDNIYEEIIKENFGGKEYKDTSVLFWNMRGYGDNHTHLQHFMNEYKSNVVALNETWKRSDLGIKKYETNNWATPPLNATTSNRHGRNSGGIYIGSDFPMVNSANLKGFSKSKINGVFFINIYFNERGLENKDRVYKYIKELVLNGAKMVVMGDFNSIKKDNVDILGSLGMKQLKTEPTYYTDINGVQKGHLNDQVWYYNCRLQLVKQLGRLKGSNIQHNSDHHALIFKVLGTHEYINRKKIILPEKDEERLGTFEEMYFHYKNNCQHFDSMKVFYHAVMNAAKDTNLIRMSHMYGKVNKTLTEPQYMKYKDMLSVAESYKRVDSETQQLSLQEAKLFHKRCKFYGWNQHIESCVHVGKYFQLMKGMLRKGKVWVEGENITDFKTKNPSVIKDIEMTKTVWTNIYTSKFQSIDEPESVEENNKNFKDNEKNSETIVIDAETLEYVLSKAKNNSSPGVSGISYKVIKHIHKIDSAFLLEVVNDIINDRCDPGIFQHMVVIPIFKGKGKDPNQVKSFRPVCLGENLYKVVEGCYLAKFKTKIEDTFGECQFAYYTKCGTNKAVEKLHQLTKDKKKCYVLSIDLASAFDSPSYSSIQNIMIKKYGNTKFVHLYKKVIDQLKLHIDLGFTIVQNIKARRGCPQGMKMSAYIFCTLLYDTIKDIMDEFPEVNWVLYSDDLTLVIEDSAQIDEILDKISMNLGKVGMKVDHEKTQFIRMGSESSTLSETITIKNKEFKAEKYLKFLGYYFEDKGVFNLQVHVDKRLKSSGFYLEQKLVNWMKTNFYFNVRVRRLFIGCRTFQKLFYGFSTMHKITHPQFENEYMFELEDKKWLDKSWVNYKEVDAKVKELVIPLIKRHFKGMHFDALLPAVLMLKPMHAIGYNLNDKTQVIDYWLKNSTGPMVDYIKSYKYIITDLMKSKRKINNETLLLSLLSGHFEKWVRMESNKFTICEKCKNLLSIEDLKSSKECCGLAIPGRIPEKEVTNEEHIKFLKFINGLCTHPMFYNKVIGKFWNMDGSNCTKKVDIEARLSSPQEPDWSMAVADLHNKVDIVCYTDGSCETGVGAGAGVKWVNPKLWELDDISTIVPGRQTNSRAELFAIYVAIIHSSKHADRKLVIRTDSKVSIQVIETSLRYWKSSGNLDRKYRTILNQDIINMVVMASEGRNIEFHWVKSHVGHYFNELADQLAKKQVEIHKKFLFNQRHLADQDLKINYFEINYNMNTNENQREIDENTGKELYKLPLFCVPDYIKTQQEAEAYIDEFWRNIVISYKKSGRPMWTKREFQHPLQIITKIEMIKGCDYGTENKIKGWNLVFIGKYDCSLMGVIMAEATRLYKYTGTHNDVMTNELIGQAFNLSFHNWTMLKEDDPLTKFKADADKWGLHGWIDGRTGRIAARNLWDIYKIDHNDPTTRERIRKYFVNI